MGTMKVKGTSLLGSIENNKRKRSYYKKLVRFYEKAGVLLAKSSFTF